MTGIGGCVMGGAGRWEVLNLCERAPIGRLMAVSPAAPVELEVCGRLRCDFSERGSHDVVWHGRPLLSARKREECARELACSEASSGGAVCV